MRTVAACCGQAAGIAVVLATALIAASSAAGSPTAASRAPTRAELVAITRVAERAPHAGTGTILVSQIRVSTAGPWARARVGLRISGSIDYAEAVLVRTRSGWHLTRHSPGTAGEWCGVGMPVIDQRNLGFPSCTSVGEARLH